MRDLRFRRPSRGYGEDFRHRLTVGIVIALLILLAQILAAL